MKEAFKVEYRKPTGPYIDRCDITEKLYDLETKRDKAFKAATEELKKVLDFDHFWHEAAPEGLLSMLEGWDHNAAQMAAMTYLEKQNRRAYTEKEKKFLVLQCDLGRLTEAIETIDRLFKSDQWGDLDFDKREAITWITNLLKVQKE